MQGLDETCSSDCVVGKDGRSVTIGTGTILCHEGYSKGVHCWRFTCKSAGWHSWFGVATRDPGDEHEAKVGHALGNLEGGFAVAGWCNGGSDGGLFPAYHAGQPTKEHCYPMFGSGDVVTVVLDCDGEGELAYSVVGGSGGQRTGEVGDAAVVRGVFAGSLPKGTALFPAFSGNGMESEFTDISFDLPVPREFGESLCSRGKNGMAK